MSFTARPRAMMAALGQPRFALQPLGCHHGPWAGLKTHDPSGGGSVMYQWQQVDARTTVHSSVDTLNVSRCQSIISRVKTPKHMYLFTLTHNQPILEFLGRMSHLTKILLSCVVRAVSTCPILRKNRRAIPCTISIQRVYGFDSPSDTNYNCQHI
jgi:hypothetical protein